MTADARARLYSSERVQELVRLYSTDRVVPRADYQAIRAENRRRFQRWLQKREPATA